MLLDAKKIKEDKEQKNREKTEGQSEEILQWKKKPIRQRQKQDTSVQNVKKKKKRITRIIQKITPHVHVVEIVTTVLKMKSQKMIGYLVFHVASGCMKPVLSN